MLQGAGPLPYEGEGCHATLGSKAAHEGRHATFEGTLVGWLGTSVRVVAWVASSLAVVLAGARP